MLPKQVTTLTTTSNNFSNSVERVMAEGLFESNYSITDKYYHSVLVF
jgi:hypothetical protein